ncbi:hypothetical protein BWZ20_15010 [Winogradskyella sp. J14-2]|uniref:DUF6090 family protein n=1 Tax=Winogradskyella sp. J14-2 TaxID=1936080 RepID=UPI0009729960|nr:DUF6090 family protein [Winogradskyella sp. J14-2]APY09532.1 hypothetical protein BWZ20_15010 [Winogradskyella sp. J14-2]
MIKFFRKIRQKLLSENKFSKYLIYAIGEIVLVVIGILIALAINDWNEQRKIGNLQKEYLTNLKKEATNNLNSVMIMKDYVTKLNSKQIELIKLISSDKDSVTEKHLSKLLVDVIIFSFAIKYDDSFLSELKNSGNLKNILNDSIRQNLIDISPIIDDLRYQEEAVDVLLKQSLNFITKDGSFAVLFQNIGEMEALGLNNLPQSDRSNLSLLYDNEFENTIMLYTIVTQTLNEHHYIYLENHLKKLIDNINKELE